MTKQWIENGKNFNPEKKQRICGSSDRLHSCRWQWSCCPAKPQSCLTFPTETASTAFKVHRNASSGFVSQNLMPLHEWYSKQVSLLPFPQTLDRHHITCKRKASCPFQTLEQRASARECSSQATSTLGSVDQANGCVIVQPIREALRKVPAC